MSKSKTTISQASQESQTKTSSPRMRVLDCYSHPGGALLGWLADEARKRNHGSAEMAQSLGVTYGYIHQLKSGVRQVAHISDAFARMCASYLGIRPIVVKLLAGRITMLDFVSPAVDQEELVRRAFLRMLDDPAARQLLPMDPHALPPEARRPLVLMYAEAASLDLFGVRELPTVLKYLQRAALVHDENEQEAERHAGLLYTPVLA